MIFDPSEKCNCGKPVRYMHGGKGSSCNKHMICPTYDELLKKNKELKDAIFHQIGAMEFTRQYVGKKTLPAIEGWSWYDAEQEAMKALGIDFNDAQKSQIKPHKAGK